MSRINGQRFSRLERFCMDVVKSGPVPRHIGFIMDGNRRYATEKGWNKIQGHYVGIKTFDETVDWCFALGIKELSYYFFSIANFKRSEEEKEALFFIIENKLQEYVDMKDMLDKHQIRIRHFGEISYLPRRMQMLFSELILYTYKYDRLTINFCTAYSSREEMTKAACAIALGIRNGYLHRSDVTESMISSTICPSGSEPLDVILRTSGEVRLSDFMLYEGCDSFLSFINTMWPEFSLWEFLRFIISYQRNWKGLQKLETKTGNEDNSSAYGKSQQNGTVSNLLESMMRRKNFLEQLERRRYEEYVRIKNGDVVENVPPACSLT